ncbi:Acetylornithine aminotransferase [Desulfovibrionales bacterium]
MSRFEALKARENQAVCNTYSRYPLAVSRASGCRLYDLDGREYVDLLAGIAVANLGHCRPELAQIMVEQALKLVHVSNFFYQEEQIALAEMLKATCHADKVFFCNSGSEANEAAIKLARRYMQIVRGRQAYEIITLENSFHGRTLAMVAATGQAKIKEGFAPLPKGFVTVPWDNLDAMAAAINPRTAGILVEMVQGEGGVRPMTSEYAHGLAALCKERDVLLVVDEIQTGLGRCGRFWAFQHYDIKPDIFTTAKGLANGLPIGAMLATDEAARGFTPGSHATTFGGGSLLAVIAAKTVELLMTDDLPSRAAELGRWAQVRFARIQAAFPDKVVQIRGLGLLLGIELAYPGHTICSALLKHGFICNLTQERVLRLLPPLTIPKTDLEAFAATLEFLLAITSS